MPTFKYKAYNTGGRPVEGTIDASGVRDAVQTLKNTGLFPAEVSESAVGKKRLFSRISSKDLALVTRQLSTLLSSGTALSEALSVLGENTGNPEMQSILSRINESVAQGSSLARALDAHPKVFSPFYRGLVGAGEESGSLDKVLPRLADYMEARARITAEVKTALTYPALMVLVGVGILSFLFAFVIPKITRMFEESQGSLPIITKVLIAVSALFRNYLPLVAGAVFVCAWALRRYFRSEKGRAQKDALILRVPLAGRLLSHFYIANMSNTLGSLLKGGVQMLKALEITKEVVDNAVFTRVLDSAIRDCAGGAPLSSSLKRHRVIPPIVAHMVSVGERSGNLDEMLLKTAEAYELEFNSGVKKALSLLEPILILVMGLAVGFIVLAILLPIFELNQIIR